MKYILDGHTPVPVGSDLSPQGMSTSNLLAWIQCMENAEGCRVAKDWIGEVKVSTVFIGESIPRWGRRPRLFETKVFGGLLDGKSNRYATWDEAAEGHKAMCARVRT